MSIPNSTSKMKLLLTLCVLNLCNCCLCVSSDFEPACDNDTSTDITNGIEFLNGSVLSNGAMYPPAFIINYTIEIRGCACLLGPCFRKCCSAGHLGYTNIYENETDCVDDLGGDFHFSKASNYLDVFPTKMSRNLIRIEGLPCDFIEDKDIEGCHKGHLLENGSLYVPTENHLYNQKEYCLDVLETENGISIKAMVCFSDEEEGYEDMGKEENIKYKLITAGMIISSPFLLATLLVYGFVPELRNLHGKALMGYVSGLLVGYIFMIYNNLKPSDSLRTCEVHAFIIYSSFMSSFFWLNVMCFDMWWSFRCMTERRNRRTAEKFRFILYCLYACGCPLLLTLFTAFMQYYCHIPLNYVRPRFGETKCWFHDRDGTFYYFYLPVIILITSNIIFFGLTAYKILSIKRETKMLRKGENKSSHYEKDKQRFILYLKLFLVMGINWTPEWLSFILNEENGKYFWIITDLCNSAQGISIFIIFVFKKRIKHLIIKRYQILRYGSTIARARDSSRSRSANTMSTLGTESTLEKSMVSLAPNAMKLSEIHRKS